MKNEKRKNKNGFTLVELIVVILIMAVIAVALAPQVMKWVEESRKSADAANYDALYESVQVALAEPPAYNRISGLNSDVTITMSTTGTTVSNGPTDGDAFYSVMDQLDPDWRSLKAKSEDGSPYTITIKASVCSLARTKAPATVEGVEGGSVESPVVGGANQGEQNPSGEKVPNVVKKEEAITQTAEQIEQARKNVIEAENAYISAKGVVAHAYNIYKNGNDPKGDKRRRYEEACANEATALVSYQNAITIYENLTGESWISNKP